MGEDCAKIESKYYDHEMDYFNHFSSKTLNAVSRDRLCESTSETRHRNFCPAPEVSSQASFQGDFYSECSASASSHLMDVTASRISRNNSLIESLSSVSNLDQSCSIPTLCTVDSVSSY